MSNAHFLNLTNGIEWMADVPRIDGMIRLQSTACEQKRWWPIIEDLDYTFLLAAATGRRCLVYDCSARKAESRAVYQGLEWVRYALTRAWFNKIISPSVRGCGCTDYFDACWHEYTVKGLGKLRYARKFLSTDAVRIEGVCRPTLRDGDYDFYRRLLVSSLVSARVDGGDVEGVRHG